MSAEEISEKLELHSLETPSPYNLVWCSALPQKNDSKLVYDKVIDDGKCDISVFVVCLQRMIMEQCVIFLKGMNWLVDRIADNATILHERVAKDKVIQKER